MIVIQIIIMLVVCGFATGFLYGIWKVEHDRDEFIRKHGYDPKYKGWEVIEDDKNQGEGKK
jgi:hypothetical protein